MNENTTTKPTVITAAQFVSEGYAKLIENGTLQAEYETAFGWKTVEDIYLSFDEHEYVVTVDDTVTDWKDYRAKPNHLLRLTWLHPDDTTTTKPPVITAAEWDTIAEAALRGECTVKFLTDDILDLHEVLVNEDNTDTTYVYEYVNENDTGFIYLDGSDRLTVTWLHPADTTAESAAANAGGQWATGDRDAYLRNDLFKRVKDTLDLTLAYLPGELAEFPEKVQTVVSDFGNYCNLAEKQIQERDIEITRLQTALASAEARADGLLEAVKPFADVYQQWRDDMGSPLINPLEDVPFGEWFWRNAENDMIVPSYQQAAKALEAPTTADGGSGEAG